MGLCDCVFAYGSCLDMTWILFMMHKNCLVSQGLGKTKDELTIVLMIDRKAFIK